MISFACPGCSARYSVKDEFAGKKTRCKKCNATIDIPEAEQPDLDPPELGFRDDEDTYRPSAPANRSSASRTPMRDSRADEDSSSSNYDPPLAPPPVPKSMPLSVGAPMAPSGGGSGVAPPPIRRQTTIADARPTAYGQKQHRSTGTTSVAGEGFFNAWVRAGLWLYVIGIGGCILPFFGYQFKVIHSLGHGSLYAALAFTIGASVCTLLGRQVVVAGLGLIVGIGAFAVAIKTYKPEDLGSDPVYSADNPAPPPDSTEQPIWNQFRDRIREANAALDKGENPVFIRGDIRLLKSQVRPEFEKRFAGYGPWEDMKRDFDALCVRVGIDGPPPAPRSTASASASSSSSSSSPPPPPDPNAQRRAGAMFRINDYDAMVKGLASRVEKGGVRESFESDLADVRDRVVAGAKECGEYGEYQQVRNELNAVEAKINGMPSKVPDKEIYTKFDHAAPWDAPAESVATFLPEMNLFNAFCIRVPPDARMNLSDDLKTQVTWKDPSGAFSLTITTEPAKDPKQLRPWVITPGMAVVAREENLVTLMSDGRASTVGLVHDLTFTSGTRVAPDGPAPAERTYMALSGGKWLVAKVTGPSVDGAWFPACDFAVRTMRTKKASENVPEPLSPVFVARRLADAPAAASALLIKAGASAEPPVLEIASDPANPARQTAVTVLKDVGTEKSAELLWKLAYDIDPVLSKAAREGLVRIDPKKADVVTFAVQDLQAAPAPENLQRRRDALITLATNAPDGRLETIAAMLEKMIVDPTYVDASADVGRALSVWNRKQTVDALLPVLNDPNAKDNPHLDAIIIAAAGTGDKKVAFPIVRWLQVRPQAVTDAAIVLGDPMEDELIKLLTSAPAARGAVCDVLLRMGSGRSIFMLERISKDKNTPPEVQRKAGEALIASRARESEKKPKK